MKMTLISAFEARGCILRGLFCDKGSPQRLFSLFTFFFFSKQPRAISMHYCLYLC